MAEETLEKSSYSKINLSTKIYVVLVEIGLFTGKNRRPPLNNIDLQTILRSRTRRRTRLAGTRVMEGKATSRNEQGRRVESQDVCSGT